jgi:hypothetical protein
MARLIVVRRRERERFEQLTREFRADPGVRVIWDRRVATESWTAPGVVWNGSRNRGRHDAARLLVIDDEPAVAGGLV